VQDLPETFVPLWAADLHMDLTVYASEDPYFTDYNAKPIWNAEKITYGDYDDTREQMVELPATKVKETDYVFISNFTLIIHCMWNCHLCIISLFRTMELYMLTSSWDIMMPQSIPTTQTTFKTELYTTVTVSENLWVGYSGFHELNINLSTLALTKFYPKKSIVKQKNLLKGGSEEEEEDILQDQVHYDEAEQQSGMGGLLGNWTRRAPVVAYWYPNVTISVLSDAKTVAPKRSIHPQMWKCKCSFERMRDCALSYVNLQSYFLIWLDFQLDADNVLDRTGEFGFFRPTIFPNDFWSLREYAYPVNETVRYEIRKIRDFTIYLILMHCSHSTLPLIIHFAPISMMKFQIYSVLEDAMEKQTSGPMGASSASEFDEIKRMFLETNPILLGTTIVVSIFHSLFEFLAFKSGKDIG
jgi:hypothetical protein